MKQTAYIPLMIGIAMAIGVWIGSGLAEPEKDNGIGSRWQKMEQILQYVESDYVDTIAKRALEEEVIEYLMQRLDPHSHYISEQDLQRMNEPLEGNFEGIGIQFNLRNDSIYVINTIAGGPSEQAGLLPGDKIVEVDSIALVGTEMDNRKVMDLLKGPQGSSVNVGVQRAGANELRYFDITRGQIPISSIDAAYSLNDSTIYVRLARFAKNTYEDFQTVVYPLKTAATKSFILDLRGNSGGYLNGAINMSDEFLTEDKVITYTEGKARPRMEFKATSDGRFEDVELVVLIDGFTASASEIVAGAIQGHDRGTIIGKRSFGKGLVQEQNEWLDGSATRLTVARYYTPNGRSIQRPYESMSSAQLPPDSLLGGIEPDVTVTRDTAGITWLYAEIVHRGLLNQFAYHYRDHEYAALSKMTETEYINSVTQDSLAAAMRGFLEDLEFEIKESEWARSQALMLNRAKAIIGRSLFTDETYFKIHNPDDDFIRAALRTLESGSRPSV